MSIFEQLVKAIADHNPDSLGASFVAEVIDVARANRVTLKANTGTFSVRDGDGGAVTCIAVAIAAQEKGNIEGSPFAYLKDVVGQILDSRGQLEVGTHECFWAISEEFEGANTPCPKHYKSEVEWNRWRQLGARFREAIPQEAIDESVKTD